MMNFNFLINIFQSNCSSIAIACINSFDTLSSFQRVIPHILQIFLLNFSHEILIIKFLENVIFKIFGIKPYTSSYTTYSSRAGPWPIILQEMGSKRGYRIRVNAELDAENCTFYELYFSTHFCPSPVTFLNNSHGYSYYSSDNVQSTEWKERYSSI